MKYALALTLLASVSAIGLGPNTPAAAQGGAAPNVTPSQPWAQQLSDVPVDPSIRFGTLPNGLRYAIKSNKTPPNFASLWLRIDAGSLMEKDDQLGLAHFMEHMAFNGTKNIPKNELIHTLERLGLQFGADLNAATAHDRTFYQLNIPSADDSKLDTGLYILREQVSAATMDPDDIDAERGVIKGEDRLRNSPSAIVGQKQLAILGEGTRVPARNPIGDMKIIATAPRQRFVDFYQCYYRPSRATVIAVGDFDVEQMEAKIKANFADWQPSGPDGPAPDLGKLRPKGQTAHVYFDPNLQSSVSISWTRSADNQPDSLAKRRDEWIRGLAIAVLNRRLDEHSRESEAPFLSASASEGDVARAFHISGINAAFLPGEWRAALAAVEKSWRQLVLFGVTEDEVQREVNTYRTQMETAVKLIASRQTAQLAASIENAVNERSVTTDPKTELDIFEMAIKDISATEISDAAKRIFVGDGPTVILTSSEPVEGGELALESAFDRFKASPIAPPLPAKKMAWAYTDFGAPGKVIDISGPDKLGAQTATFSNGLKLTVKHTDFEKDAIYVNVLTGIGEQNFSPEHYDPLAAAVGNLFPGGLGKMDVDEIARSINGKRVGGGLATLGTRFLMTGNTGHADLKLEMEYLAAYMTDPAYRSDSFAKAIAAVPVSWQFAKSSPQGVYGLEVATARAGGDKRVGYAPPEVAANWKMDALRARAQKLLVAGPIQIVLTGDIDLDQAIAAVAPTFGALPPRLPAGRPAPGAGVRKFSNPTPTPLIFTHTGLGDQALGSVSWPTPDVTGPRKPGRQLAVLKAVLQLRVLDVIREKEALAYSPRVTMESSPDYKDFGFIEVQAAIAPDKLPAFYAAVDQITNDLRNGLVSQDELLRARQPLIEHERKAMENNSWWRREALASVYQPSTLDDAFTAIADFESVTPALIRDLARTYLLPSKAFKASIVPAGDKAAVPAAPASAL